MQFRKIIISILIVSMVLTLAACGKAPAVGAPGENRTEKTVVVTDDVGRTLEFTEPIERVVVANRYNSELIRAIGAADKIVSVDRNTAQDREYWGQFDPENVIGKGQSELNYEKIVELNPQILITPRNGSYEEDIKKLKAFDIEVVVVTGWDNADIQKQIEILGTLFQKEQQAQDLITFFEENLAAVQERLQNVGERKTVYWEYGDPFTTCVPGTSNDGWHNMIVSAGGDNIFGDVSLAGKDIDPEMILLQNPDLIIKTSSGPALKNTGVYTPPSQEDYVTMADEMVSRAGWSELQAVKDGNLYITTGFCAGGLGKMIGAVYTAKWLYPELMEDIDPDAVFAEWMRLQGVDPIDGHVYRVWNRK